MNNIGQLQNSRTQLKRVFIEAELPKALQPLQDIANNLWWCWNRAAIDLFTSIDPDKFVELRWNPVALLDQLSAERAAELASDKNFIKQVKAIHKDFTAYMKKKPAKDAPKIGYFCMEYGLHASVRLYSGGLGVLAGDFMKEASDCNVDMVAVGLLYRFGYFQQALSLHGDQINNYPMQQFTKLPTQPVWDADGNWVKVNINLKGRTVHAKVWSLAIGRMTLYLLDTDLDENHWEDRGLTHQLYGGDNEHRLKQEILLGIGGVRALKAMGIEREVYHLNEGHAAFSGLERLRNYVQEEGLSFAQAVEVVRGSSLFTTHTPVPAGHDYFNENLMREYLYNYTHELGIDWKQLIALGKIDVDNIHELFSMSHLAIRLSSEINGVSKLHGTVSQKMFNVLYPGYNSEELHIGYVTNSVHYPTWIANEWHELYLKTFGKKFLADQSNHDYWRKIYDVPAKKLLGIRQTLKDKLIDYVKETMQSDLMRRGENPRQIFETVNKINNQALVIGFARRFATYKRAHLLFANLERLNEIVNHPERPVMFIFSGKAHPADKGGQALIKRIVEISKRPEFAGKVIFLENYNMESAKLLVQGVDIWLNTPTRPKEASGTSGMKAAMNGVMNFSVLDGWWAEGYREDAGWALPLERTYEDQDLQNELDAELIYNTLQYDLVPKYYETGDKDYSETWVSYIKTIIAEVAPYFTMKRMMDHYFERFYNKLATRSKVVHGKDYTTAKSLVEWKSDMRNKWEHIQVVEQNVLDTENKSLAYGENFTSEIKLNLAGIDPKFVGVEIVFFQRQNEEELAVILNDELKMTATEGATATYQSAFKANMTGVYEYGFRVFPKHESIAHRLDFPLVKWI
ncbi:MAG: alpha-glucan family phosphorylase [Saprospiraceae bacterium]